jgi:hypothetical protein
MKAIGITKTAAIIMTSIMITIAKTHLKYKGPENSPGLFNSR